MVFKIIVTGSNPVFLVFLMKNLDNFKLNLDNFKNFFFKILSIFLKNIKDVLIYFQLFFYTKLILFLELARLVDKPKDNMKEDLIKFIKYKNKEKIFKNFFSIFYGDFDYNLYNFFKLNLNNIFKLNLNNIFKTYFRIKYTNSGFFFFNNLFFKKLKVNDSLYNTFMDLFKYIYEFLKYILVFFFFLIFIYNVFILRSLGFNKIVFAWVGILMFVYWLLSGFVFFFKKYQFGKYTTSIQRFWRRTYILFWLIEGATFSVFLYLTINASQESFYMFDQISFFKSHLFSWKTFIFRIFLIVLLLYLTYLLILSLKWNIFSKNVYLLVIITFLLTYFIWVEFYQFLHILNFYGNLNWVYDLDEHLWTLEVESKKTRIVNHYIMLLFILKFWHIIFIYGFWVFFVLRSVEVNRIRYSLLSANYQNFIILYIFSWVFLYPWFKFFFKNILYTPYYWFYINNRYFFLRVLFNDMKLIYYSLTYDFFKNLNVLKRFEHSFFYFKSSNYDNNFEFFRKNVIKNKILKTI